MLLERLFNVHIIYLCDLHDLHSPNSVSTLRGSYGRGQAGVCSGFALRVDRFVGAGSRKSLCEMCIRKMCIPLGSF